MQCVAVDDSLSFLAYSGSAMLTSLQTETAKEPMSQYEHLSWRG